MERPLPEVVEALVRYGHKAESILGTDKKPGWSVERAVATLAKCRHEEQIALGRAAKKAGRIDELKPRGKPLQIERIAIAAVALEQATSPEDIIGAIWSTSCYLTDEEAVELKGYLIRLFRGEL